MTTVLIIAAILLVVIVFGYGLNHRQQRLLREENMVRDRLGLPPLTRTQFEIQVVEKSADFRSNINQHM